jgi:hypothetical protein
MGAADVRRPAQRLDGELALTQGSDGPDRGGVVDGRPVALRVHDPWSGPAEEARTEEGFWTRAARVLDAVVFVASS